MYFCIAFERRTYTGTLQNPSARLEELRQRQNSVLDTGGGGAGAEGLLERLERVSFGAEENESGGRGSNGAAE